MGKMDDFEPLPVEDNPSGTPADKPTITDRPVRKPRTRLTKWLAKIAGVYDGDLTPKTEDEYYLNEIAENGGGLPKATAEDAGKAIVVNDSGEYALDTVGGDQEPLIVTVGSGPSGYTADKTAAEIYDAFTANRQVLCVWQNFFFYPSAPPTQDDAFFDGFRTTGDNVVANIFTGFNKYIVHVSNNLGVTVTVREYKPSTSK